MFRKSQKMQKSFSGNNIKGSARRYWKYWQSYSSICQPKTQSIIMKYGNIIFLVISPVNATMAILLNLVEIFYIWQMKLTKNKSIVLFVNLSLADILLGLTVCSIKVIAEFKLPPDHILTIINFYLAASFIQISLLVSILTNIIVTSERLLLVKRPFLYRQITKVHRVLICIAI